MTSPGFFYLLVCSFLLSKDNIKINLKAIEWEEVDWVDLSQDRENLVSLLNTVMDLQVSYKKNKFGLRLYC